MCRNIHTLFNYEPPATEDEVRASALQYVRKISGFTKPSRANEEAFARAIDEVAESSAKLLAELVTTAERETARSRPSGSAPAPPSGSPPPRVRSSLRAARRPRATSGKR